MTDERRPWSPLVNGIKAHLTERGTAEAAALTFYSLFAIGPVLTLGLAAGARFLGDAQARAQLERFLTEMVSSKASTTLVDVLQRQDSLSLGSLITANTLLLFWAASGFLLQLRASLTLPDGESDDDETEEQFRASRAGLRFLQERLQAIGLAAGTIALFVLLTLTSMGLTAVLRVLDMRSALPGFLSASIDAIAGLTLTTASLALIYVFVPRRRPSWRAAAAGALLAASVYVGTKALLALYLRNAELTTTYGASGSLVATLLWLFVSSNLLLLGNRVCVELDRSPAAAEESTRCVPS